MYMGDSLGVVMTYHRGKYSGYVCPMNFEVGTECNVYGRRQSPAERKPAALVQIFLIPQSIYRYSMCCGSPKQ